MSDHVVGADYDAPRQFDCGDATLSLEVQIGYSRQVTRRL
jgi:hypothetical protein